MERISVILVDQEDLVREGIKGWLEASHLIKVKADVSSCEEALEFLSKEEVDVCVSDLTFPGKSGFEFLKELNQQHPDVSSLVLSSKRDSTVIFDSFSSGANGFIPKKTEPQDLVTAITWVAGGRWYLSPQITQPFVEASMQLVSASDSSDTAGTNGLSSGLDDKERELLRLVSEGMTFVEIAKKLDVNVRSVERIKSKIEEKIGAKNLADLIRAAIRYGLIEP